MIYYLPNYKVTFSLDQLFSFGIYIYIKFSIEYQAYFSIYFSLIVLSILIYKIILLEFQLSMANLYYVN